MPLLAKMASILSNLNRDFRESERGIAFLEKVAYPAGVMKYSLFLLAVIGFGLASCERHEWESKPGKPGTEELFKHDPKKEEEKGDEEGERPVE